MLKASSKKEMRYISVRTYQSTTTETTHNVPAPTNYIAGDLIIIFLSVATNLTQTLTNSGWTTVVNTYDATAQNLMHVAYRTAGSEPSTYGVNQSVDRGLVAACVVLRNAAYNSFATAVSASGTGVPVSITPFNAETDGIIYYSALSTSTDRNNTPPTGYTSIAELDSQNTGGTNLAIARRVPNASQSTTSVTGVWDVSDSNQSALFDFKNV
jgi:hypothetical protein